MQQVVSAGEVVVYAQEEVIYIRAVGSTYERSGGQAVDVSY